MLVILESVSHVRLLHLEKKQDRECTAVSEGHRESRVMAKSRKTKIVREQSEGRIRALFPP